MKWFSIVAVLMIFTVQPQPLNAQVYKWVDEHGKLHFSDQPPLKGKVETIHLNKINSYNSPQVIDSEYVPTWKKEKQRRVVMYSAEWCGICKKAKAYFKEKGIHYTEYDIDKNATGKREYKKLNAKGVPVIFIGDKRLNGFSKGSFDELYGT